MRNFGTKEECEYVKAQTGWEDAKVTNHGNNESQIGRVDYRRLAKAKGINQPLFDFASPLSEYFIRNYAIVHGLTGHDVWPAGQEALSLIKYNVSGEEFRPHCDGDCTSTPNKRKGRLYCDVYFVRGVRARSANRAQSTHFLLLSRKYHCDHSYIPQENHSNTNVQMYIRIDNQHSHVERRYCQASERGGHTHFSTAKVKLKPKEGDLLVFSYLHVDGTNDYTRLSQHGVSDQGG